MDNQERINRAWKSLEGLAVGDAFGQTFFLTWETTSRYVRSGEWLGWKGSSNDFVRLLVDRRELQPGPWPWTDDTALAIEVVEALFRHNEINGDDLATRFSLRYKAEPNRGYGGAMHSLLPRLSYESWQEAAPNLFNGTGSYGNGAAMRVAPLGAYFCDDPHQAAQQARLSAEVTHTHNEGIAGAIGVAVAAAYAAQSEAQVSLFDYVLPYLPDSEVRFGVERAKQLGGQASVRDAVLRLGNGSGIAAQDTVPFCLWCAARHINNYEEALWTTVSAGGDRDTNCAIVGAIVAAGMNHEQLPLAWRNTVEGWPYWFASLLNNPEERL